MSSWRDQLVLDAFIGLVVAVILVIAFITGRGQRDKELNICRNCQLCTAIFDGLCLQCKSDQIESKRAMAKGPSEEDPSS